MSSVLENKVNHFSKKPCFNDIRKWALNVTSEASEAAICINTNSASAGRKALTEH